MELSIQIPKGSVCFEGSVCLKMDHLRKKTSSLPESLESKLQDLMLKPFCLLNLVVLGKKKKLFNLQYSRHIRINSYGTFIIPVSFSFNVKLLRVFACSLTVPKTLVFICKLKLFFVFLQPGRQ